MASVGSSHGERLRLEHGPRKRVERYRWNVESQTPPGRRIATRHYMTREEALERDPTAEPVGLPQYLDMPDSPEEIEQRRMQRKPSPAGRKPPF